MFSSELKVLNYFFPAEQYAGSVEVNSSANEHSKVQVWRTSTNEVSASLTTPSPANPLALHPLIEASGDLVLGSGADNVDLLNKIASSIIPQLFVLNEGLWKGVLTDRVVSEKALRTVAMLFPEFVRVFYDKEVLFLKEYGKIKYLKRNLYSSDYSLVDMGCLNMRSVNYWVECYSRVKSLEMALQDKQSGFLSMLVISGILETCRNADYLFSYASSDFLGCVAQYAVLIVKDVLTTDGPFPSSILSRVGTGIGVNSKWKEFLCYLLYGIQKEGEWYNDLDCGLIRITGGFFLPVLSRFNNAPGKVFVSSCEKKFLRNFGSLLAFIMLTPGASLDCHTVVTKYMIKALFCFSHLYHYDNWNDIPAIDQMIVVSSLFYFDNVDIQKRSADIELPGFDGNSPYLVVFNSEVSYDLYVYALFCMTMREMANGFWDFYYSTKNSHIWNIICSRDFDVVEKGLGKMQGCLNHSLTLDINSNLSNNELYPKDEIAIVFKHIFNMNY